jgi:hypothetical protein
MDECDFFGCREPICEADAKLQSGMRFCQTHSDEAAGYIRKGEISDMLSFWIRAQDGADVLAGRIPH